MPGANRPPRLRPLQSPAPGGGRGGRREDGAGPARPPPPTPVNTAEPRPLPGGRRVRFPPRPCAALRWRAQPRPGVPPLPWVGGTGEAAPAPARRCPDVHGPDVHCPDVHGPAAAPTGAPRQRSSPHPARALRTPRAPRAGGGEGHGVKWGAGLGGAQPAAPGGSGRGMRPRSARGAGAVRGCAARAAASRAAPFCTTYFVSPWSE